MEREAGGDLDEVLSPLRELRGPTELVRAVGDLLSGVDERDVRHRIEDLARGLTALSAAVEEVRERLDALAEERARVPFGEQWWQRRRQAAGTSVAAADWAEAYAHAVLAGRHDVALRLASPAEGLVPGELAEDGLAGAQALAGGDPAGAVGILRRILDGAWAASRPSHDRVELEILLARALLRTPGGLAEARDRLLAAAGDGARLGDPALLGRVVAAQGECELAAGDEEAALTAFQQALASARDEPVALLGLGALAERHGEWSRAEELYDRALGSVPDRAALERLRIPLTGTLYWRLAERLSVHPGAAEEALRALDRALELGIGNGEPYPERHVYMSRGYLLERLGRAGEAAHALAAAADRYTWSGRFKKARVLLERAVQLDPGEAGHRWSLADVLRLLAQRPDGTADPSVLAAAADQWRAGIRLRSPARDEAWAHVAHALIRVDDVQGERSERARLWASAEAAERAVLLDGALANAWQHLSSVYGDLGHQHTALAAADRALAANPADETAAYHRSRALLAVGRVAEAAEALPTGTEPWLRVQRAVLHLVRDEPQEALAAMGSTGAPATDPVQRLLHAYFLVGAGQDGAAAAELAAAESGAEPLTRSEFHVAAWHAYIRGSYDRAGDLLRQALECGPAAPEIERIDLGQVLLARGGADDLVSGEQRLNEGVHGCRRWDTLALLVTTELPFLVRRAAGHEHEEAVAAVVDRVRALAVRRMEQLLRQDGDPRAELQDVLGAAPAAPGRPLAARAALARAELEESPETALEQYLALTVDVVEAWEGVVRAVTQIRDRWDGAATSAPADPPGYVRLRRAVAPVPAGASAAAEARRLGRGLAVRAAVAAVLSGREREALDVLADEAPPGRGDGEVAAAVAATVRDGQAYWTLLDHVIAVREDHRLTPALRAWAEDLAGAMSLDAVHRTRRSDMDMSAVYPLEGPVVVSLGPGLVVEDPGPDWVLFRELVPRMRERIRQRTGITVPGIVFRGDEQTTAGYRICWERQQVRRGTVSSLPVSGDDPGGLADVVAEVEDVLVANVERLFGPDDLDQWCRESAPGWRADGHPAPARLVGDPESRLRTHRVLRLLVREGFPLGDGARVLDALAEAVASGADDALGIAARVRTALARRVPGVDSEQRVLPAELEQLVAAGLHETGAGPVWQDSWAAAAELVRSVGDWQRTGSAGAPGTRTAVVVSDPRVRDVLWRLLAPTGHRTHVVAAQETAAARSGAPVR